MPAQPSACLTEDSAAESQDILLSAVAFFVRHAACCAGTKGIAKSLAQTFRLDVVVSCQAFETVSFVCTIISMSNERLNG